MLTIRSCLALRTARATAAVAMWLYRRVAHVLHTCHGLPSFNDFGLSEPTGRRGDNRVKTKERILPISAAFQCFNLLQA
eukprot:12470948-Alexandrium_andersonii.AAC.1